MDRRAFLAGSLALLAAPTGGGAQQAAKLHRLGYLSPDSRPSPTTEAFRQGLRDLGWIEGQNIVIEYRWAGEQRERLADLAAELVRLKVDVILAVSTPGALAAKKATRVIPIVIPVATEPVATGLVASLARPGGNVTGFSAVGVDVTAKRLELLKEAVPTISKVVVLANPTHPASALEFKNAEIRARALGVQLQMLAVRGYAELEKAFSEAIRLRADGVVVLFDRLFLTESRRIAGLAAQHRLAAIHFANEFVEAGGLLAYGANIPELHRRAATYVDKILKGTKAGDLPVEQPTRFELVINLKTAKALGLTIPPSVLARADEVIQ